MAKLVLDDIGSTLTNTAATTINNNNTKIEQALENTLSRDGSTPNSMSADIDLNSNDLLNVNITYTDSLVLDGQVVTLSDLSALPPEVMTKAIYDPQNKNSDAFARANHTGTQPLSTISDAQLTVESAIDPFIEAPSLKRGNQDRWSIYAFNGGEVERAKALALKDFQAVINTALDSGEKIYFPPGQYPIRSLSGTHGVDFQGTVDVEAAGNAEFIVGDIFWNQPSNVFQFLGDVPVLENASPMATFKWSGGLMSGRQLTADHGTGSGFGNGLFNVVGHFKPKIEDVFFDGGVVTPTFNLVGAGAMDTLLGWNQNVGGVVQNCGFRGAFDLAFYGNGYRVVSTLGSNPIATTNLSSTVTVTAIAHGMRNGDRCHLKDVVGFNNVTLPDGEYAVAGVTTDTFTTTATGTANATGSGGGSAVVFTNSRTNKRSETMLGESTTLQGNFFTRNTNSIGIKRNMRNVYVLNNMFRKNANDISTSGVGEYEGGDGKRLRVVNNNHFFTMNWPIRLQGGGPDTLVAFNVIENWGRQIFDDGATAVNLSSGFPLSAIDIHSMDGAEVVKNTIRMTDNFAGATWVGGEEPSAITLRRNTDYIGGCVDCTVENNLIVDVPQHFNIDSNSLRTRLRKNRTRGGGTVAPALAGTATVMEVTNNYVSGTIDIGTTGIKTVDIPHGLPFTPDAAHCAITLGPVTSNSFALAWIRVVSTNATNVSCACNVTTAAVGQTVALNLTINNQNP